MRFVFEENSVLRQLRERLLKATVEMTAATTPHVAGKLIPVETDYSSLTDGVGFYVLREGMVTVSVDMRSLYFLEEGDAFFSSGLSNSSVQIKSEFATVCDFYSLTEAPQSSQYLGQLYELLGLQQALMNQLIGQLFKGERDTAPKLRSLAAGEVIVREGEISSQVFTLLEGHAEVTAGGEMVGEVKADELVGVIGALCGVPRIATVTASVPSLVISLEKDEFVDLLSLRPHTVLKLIEDFARIISSSNQELRSLKAGR